MVAMADLEAPDRVLVKDLHPPVLVASRVRAGISMTSLTRMASGSHPKVIPLGIE
jgi:hypothetical protein